MEKEQFVNLMSQVEADMFHLAFSVLHREQECADAVQEAVVKAYAGRNTLKKQEYFKTWIMRILLLKYSGFFNLFRPANAFNTALRR